MAHSYDAILDGDRVKWIGDPPPPTSGEVPVRITVLQEPEIERAERGRRMAAIMEELAQQGGITSIPDPAAWEREVREDRSLPGRD